MGFSKVNVDFVITKDQLFDLLLGQPITINITQGREVTIRSLSDHRKVESGNTVVHHFNARIEYDGSSRQSNGVLVSNNGNFNFVGSFELEIYNDNLSE